MHLQNIDPDSNYFSSFFSSVDCQLVSLDEYSSLCTKDDKLYIYSQNIRSFNANSDKLFCSFQES